jgi:thiamine transport system ATP-binding protein
MAALEIEQLRFRYEDMQMEFDLQVESGEFLGVFGPSGAGKSTLLSLIAGFERAESGSIRVNGQEIAALRPNERPVTMLFQDNNLFAHLTVEQNVGLGIHPGLRLTAEQRTRSAQRWNGRPRRLQRSGGRTRCPAASGSGPRSPAAWYVTGPCCCWTNPSPR